jgi:hypothetical protein
MRRDTPTCSGFRGMPGAYTHWGPVRPAPDFGGRTLCDRCWGREVLERYGHDREGRVNDGR